MRNKTSLWRQTPPAIFPVCLGFMGLGLAWRNGSEFLPVPEEIGDLLLGLSTAFFVFFALSYFAKLLRRPMVIFEDLKSPPARAGVSAVAMSTMLLAAALLPLDVSAPQVWWAGVVLQVIAVALGVHAIWKDPPGTRAFTPFQFLTFVGPVVAPIAGIKLGYATESFWLAMLSMPFYIIITIGYLGKLIRVRPPVPLRPSLAIFLAPTCLFALTFGQEHMVVAFAFFYVLAFVVFVILLIFGPWMMRGGWTPVWGSFTFPVATFTNLQVLALQLGYGKIAEIGLVVGLSIATPLILFIVYRSGMSWVVGDLARKSGAATA